MDDETKDKYQQQADDLISELSQHLKDKKVHPAVAMAGTMEVAALAASYIDVGPEEFIRMMMAAYNRHSDSDVEVGTMSMEGPGADEEVH